MKIKTITCHDVYNYGATLQAYALMKYLQEEGHDVEIIDYVPEYLTSRYDLFAVSPQWRKKSFLIRAAYVVAKFPMRWIRRSSSCRQAFDKFKKMHLHVTNRRYCSNVELRTNPPLAEIYIAGSDQIWNTSYGNGRDPAFYLDFAPFGTRRVSYAASFSISEILPEYRSFVKEMIEKLDYVSVREREGMDILKSIGIEGGVHVLDPVFLLNRSFWEDLAGEQISGKYILVYDFEKNSEIEIFVKNVAKERGLKIYAINNYSKTPYADCDYYNSGPTFFLSLIRDAEVVVGNSFHALAFSLIFKKEFFVFGRIKQAVNSRMQDLLTLCNLDDRIINADMDCPDKITPIHYGKIREILKRRITTSKAFLKHAVAIE